MIEFIGTSLTITLNHNQFTIAQNKASAEPLTAEDSLLVLFALFCTPTAASFGIRLAYNSSKRTPRKIFFSFCPKMQAYWPVT
jgi:hypothetical protein